MRTELLTMHLRSAYFDAFVLALLLPFFFMMSHEFHCLSCHPRFFVHSLYCKYQSLDGENTPSIVNIQNFHPVPCRILSRREYI